MAKDDTESPSEPPVSWVVNRKVWLGGSVATFATALTGITIWALQEFAGISIPADIGAHLLILFGGLLAVIVYFVQAYWVTEPTTLPKDGEIDHKLSTHESYQYQLPPIELKKEEK